MKRLFHRNTLGSGCFFYDRLEATGVKQQAPGGVSMYKTLLPLVFLLSTARALAIEVPLEITEYIDDVKVIAYLHERDIDKEPQWTPFEGPPPLSIADALEAVHGYINADAEFADAALTGIELKPIPHHAMHWHYLVKVRFKLDGKPRPHFFVVLMDGKVISAIKRPEPIY
jgi:hypothetical protein